MDSNVMYAKGFSEEFSISANTSAQVVGPFPRSGEYQISVTGSTVYLRQSNSRGDALNVTAPGGSLTGCEFFGGNAVDWYFDVGDYLAAITESGTAKVRIHWARGV